MRKFLITATTAVLMAGPSLAGGIAPVIIEDVPVVEDKPASSVSPLLILGLLILIGVLISRDNDEQPT